jgi:hypothetical protein
MSTKKSPYLLNSQLFFKKLTRNLLTGFLIILCSLGGGMLGYHHLERMSWIDAYENASMILSGMGPVTAIETTAGKLFAGTYALFSGIVFLVVIAIIFAPVIHRFFHKFHIEEEKFGK